MTKDVVTLIPARGGSKNVPRKNVRLLGGKPLLEYSIDAAVASKEIGRIIVSTEDDEIAAIATRNAVEVLKRPLSLATDNAKTLDVIKHCITEVSEKHGKFDYLVVLQPTTPFRNPSKIDEGIKMLRETTCDSVISHIRVDYFHPNRMKRIVNGRIAPYCENEIENVTRPDLPEAYYRDGAFYAMRSALPVEKNTLFGDDVRPLLHDRKYFVNIDTEKDWQVAEYLLPQYRETFYLSR